MGEVAGTHGVEPEERGGRRNADASDAEVVQRVRSGDREAFRILVERYQVRVLSLIMRAVRDQSYAEELAQEVFLRAFQSINGFRSDATFATWITRIALNRINSHFTSRAHREQMQSEPFSINRHDRADHGHEQRELQRMFALHLNALPRRYREVLTLCALEQRSYEEVAQILEVPVGTVRSRLNKARLLLKDAVAKVLIEER